MKLLYDFFPLLLFFAAFKLYDIYIATAAAIVATLCKWDGTGFGPAVLKPCI
jgi:intracellular septation protein